MLLALVLLVCLGRTAGLVVAARGLLALLILGGEEALAEAEISFMLNGQVLGVCLNLRRSSVRVVGVEFLLADALDHKIRICWV